MIQEKIKINTIKKEKESPSDAKEESSTDFTEVNFDDLGKD